MKNCPSCKSIQVERVHRKSWELFLSRFHYYPFVCNECGRRFIAAVHHHDPSASGLRKAPRST